MKPEDFGLPIGEPVDIGSGCTVTLYTHDDEVIGLTEGNTAPDGKPCMGFVAFRGANYADNEKRPQWTVESARPLTLSPSIQCRSCPHHGFIREGKWVPA